MGSVVSGENDSSLCKRDLPAGGGARGRGLRKEDGRQGPLGIASLEDKIVQQAFVTVLNCIYEEDFVGFSYGFRPGRSQRFLKDLRDRMQAFALELHPEKTRLLEFGRYAALDRKKRGEGKPETFNFLGFTHFCGKHKKTGRFIVGRKTIRKRLIAKIKAVGDTLFQRRHDPMIKTGVWLKAVVQG
jgi:hypothetical protein